MSNEAIEFYRSIVLKNIEETKDTITDTKYKLYVAIVNNCNNLEELKDLADFNMQNDFLEYTKSISNRLGEYGTTMGELEEVLNGGYEINSLSEIRREEIEKEKEETRAEMTSTVDMIINDYDKYGDTIAMLAKLEQVKDDDYGIELRMDTADALSDDTEEMEINQEEINQELEADLDDDEGTEEYTEYNEGVDSELEDDEEEYKDEIEAEEENNVVYEDDFADDEESEYSDNFNYEDDFDEEEYTEDVKTLEDMYDEMMNGDSELEDDEEENSIEDETEQQVDTELEDDEEEYKDEQEYSDSEEFSGDLEDDEEYQFSNTDDGFDSDTDELEYGGNQNNKSGVSSVKDENRESISDILEFDDDTDEDEEEYQFNDTESSEDDNNFEEWGESWGEPKNEDKQLNDNNKSEHRKNNGIAGGSTKVQENKKELFNTSTDRGKETQKMLNGITNIMGKAGKKRNSYFERSKTKNKENKPSMFKLEDNIDID